MHQCSSSFRWTGLTKGPAQSPSVRNTACTLRAYYVHPLACMTYHASPQQSLILCNPKFVVRPFKPAKAQAPYFAARTLLHGPAVLLCSGGSDTHKEKKSPCLCIGSKLGPMSALPRIYGMTWLGTP